jgi:hypothetical protein
VQSWFCRLDPRFSGGPLVQSDGLPAATAAASSRDSLLFPNRDDESRQLMASGHANPMPGKTRDKLPLSVGRTRIFLVPLTTLLARHHGGGAGPIANLSTAPPRHYRRIPLSGLLFRTLPAPVLFQGVSVGCVCQGDRCGAASSRHFVWTPGAAPCDKLPGEPRGRPAGAARPDFCVVLRSGSAPKAPCAGPEPVRFGSYRTRRWCSRRWRSSM